MAYIGGGAQAPIDWTARDEIDKLREVVTKLERQVAELQAALAALDGTQHILARKPPNGGGGHTPGIGWLCTGCDWRFSYDTPEGRAHEVWVADKRHVDTVRSAA